MKGISINFYTLIVLINFKVCISGFMSWIIPSSSEVPSTRAKLSFNVGNSDAVLSRIPFEMKIEDEKFINSVVKYTSEDLSVLDVCHHKVIIDLKKSCSKLTEEDLSKTAVNLLNCQSAVEGRNIYPCTSEMVLYDCTKDMDQTTWNAYHIVSNRVRAVCYHFRQQQFTAKTEMTVNRLMLSAEEQINSMRNLEESQDKLKQSTSDTLNTLKAGHDSLKKQQNDLSVANSNVHNFVISNMRELHREKRLITSGQKDLANIFMSIKAKLEDAQIQLLNQADGQRNVHHRIIQDLSEIQGSANRVWDQIDQSTKKILAKHEEALAHHQQLMEDLRTMNDTVHHLTRTLVKMRLKLEENFSWMSEILGGTDSTVQKLYSFVLHFLYCVLGMLASTFLQVPYVTRLSLILLVPLNALIEMKGGNCLSFSTLTLVLLFCLALNVGSKGMMKLLQSRRKKVVQAPLNHSQTEYSFLPSNENESNNRISNSNNVSSYEYGSERKSRSKTKEDRFSSCQSIFINKFDCSTGNAINTSISKHDDEDILQEDLSSIVPRRLSIEIEGNASPSRNCSLFDSSSLVRMTEGSFSPLESITEDGESNRRFIKQRRTGSFTPKQICSALCRNGLRCRNVASVDVGSPLARCRRHIDGVSRESTPVS